MGFLNYEKHKEWTEQIHTLSWCSTRDWRPWRRFCIETRQPERLLQADQREQNARALFKGSVHV